MRFGLLALLSTMIWAAGRMAAADEPVDYVRQVKSVLQGRCYSCHGVLKQKSSLRLDTAASIIQGGDSGAAIVPGKASESLLVERISDADPDSRMPPEGKPLTAEQIALVTRWIDQGATAPADEEPQQDPARHWAFQPPVRPALPAAGQDDAAPGNPIDALLAARRAAQELTPLPPVEPALLLRRVYLDLTGLPPSREALHRFLADPSDEAYRHVVDELLASPQYGERWARHWMDVWRYSDWYGRRMENDVRNSYPHIWRWRDWIVRSLNQDDGYDAMVRAMLAADEISPEDDAEIVATGFIVRNWFSLNYDQWMRDLVEHTGKAFLGLRLNCALCHDHKYDPITQEEYFRFRAFFEPLELRQDRVPGGPALEKYIRYKPGSGSSLRPIEAGLARIYDETLDAETYMYAGGDARQRIEGKPPVSPGVPAVLGGAIHIEPVELPPRAWYPGLKPWAQQDEIARAEHAVGEAHEAVAAARRKQTEESVPLGPALAQAEAALASLKPPQSSPPGPPEPKEGEPREPKESPPPSQAQQAAQRQVELVRDKLAALELAVATAKARRALAQAQLESLKARIAADKARYEDEAAAGNGEPLAHVAFKAERAAALAGVQASLTAAQQAVVDARIKAAADEKAKGGVEKAKQQLAAAEKAIAPAQQAAAADGTSYTPLGPQYQQRSTGRRRALAEWITNRGNPLTARVAVNHIWKWHFGRPLTPNVVDLGLASPVPVHRELLDWLAVELMESGWSMKHLHRLIVTSQAYRMSSAVAADDPRLAMDKDNRTWWHYPARRMEAETVRDAILAAAGQLDLTMGGPEIDNQKAAKSRRRAIYFTIYPEDGGSAEFVNLFDAPDPCDCYRRSESIMPQQALALVNSELVLGASRHLARLLQKQLGQQTGTEAPAESLAAQRTAFVTAAFEQILSRSPRANEMTACSEFLEAQRAVVTQADAAQLAAPGPQGVPPAAADPEQRARESLVRALLNHSDFVTIR